MSPSFSHRCLGDFCKADGCSFWAFICKCHRVFPSWIVVQCTHPSSCGCGLGYFCGVRREREFCFYYITTNILAHVFLCTSARIFCVYVCLCSCTYIRVGAHECGGYRTLGIVPQEPSFFFSLLRHVEFTDQASEPQGSTHLYLPEAEITFTYYQA